VVRRPLEDVRILAIEQFGAGPWATLQLADLGADVIKIEDPDSGGDVGRYVPPYRSGEDSLFFETFNRGKRSVSLDLRSPEGRRAFEALVRDADAVFSNLRGDGPEKLRIRYGDLMRINPRIVCCSLSGFGMTGPRAAEPAYDYILQGLTGWMSMTGEPDGPPTKSGASLVDYSGGYVAALSLLAGVWRARRDGFGCDCDVSLFETALSLLTYVGTWAASRGRAPQRLAESAHPSIVPFQAFRTADGWMTVACAKQKFWVNLCRALELEDLLDDERFADFDDRSEHRDELLEILRPLFRARETGELVGALSGAGVPCGAVNDVLGALDDPQVEARAAVARYEHPSLGDVRVIASPFADVEYRRAPFRGEHTEELT
jgi:crotonobetainyl-CoA:carnitine CoA-transferase CaiB-like acyl-CoA transferase